LAMGSSLLAGGFRGVSQAYPPRRIDQLEHQRLT
jgi:hypothetical protein